MLDPVSGLCMFVRQTMAGKKIAHNIQNCRFPLCISDKRIRVTAYAGIKSGAVNQKL